MGTKQNPGAHDCYAKALPNEPMFVLLARDPDAPLRVEAWARARLIAINAGTRPESDRAMVDEAHLCAIQMRRWRADNDGRWRKPPAPEPLTYDQLIERLKWLATGTRGAIPGWLPINGWDDGIREVAQAALDNLNAMEAQLEARENINVHD
jgi:hypothetical protein